MSELDETNSRRSTIYKLPRERDRDTCRASAASQCRPMASFKLPGPEPAQTLEGHEGAVLSLSLGCNWFLCSEDMVCTWNAKGGAPRSWTKNGQYIMTASQERNERNPTQERGFRVHVMMCDVLSMN